MVTDTFFLEVYPYVAYGAPNNGTCPTNLWPMHIGGSTVPQDFYYGDVDPNGNIVLGGLMSATVYINGTYANSKAYIASYSNTWSLNFLHTFDSYTPTSTA